MDVVERLAALRELMKNRDLAAYLVPSTDPHQSEYVAATWQRRGFISGFDGSAGTVVVTREKGAGLWTDSRYFLQADQQLQGTGIELFKMGQPGVPEITDWLPTVLGKGDRLGLDPKVHSVEGYESLARELEPRGISLHPVVDDLVEAVWADERPSMPDRPVRLHPVEYAGVSAEDKLARLREAMRQQDEAEAHVLSALDEIAWLFNLRGADVEYNPVFIAYAIVERERALLFVDLNKIGDELRGALPEDVELRPYEAVEETLQTLARAEARVWIDPSTTSQRVAELLGQGAELLRKHSPVPGWKAVKNKTEIEGMRAAHLRDGVAMVRFLRWLEGAVAKGGESEISLAEKLESLRAEGEHFVGLSFETIAGYGGHGAIVHYAADEESSAQLKPEGILLVDSGGQYLDGTTDITRTMALGPPTDEQRMAFTLVLKGHLALGHMRFPEGTNGYQLDVLARAPLWSEGLNYGHGTGHGVGAHLCVHEGPFSVSLRKNLTPLAAGHVLSNEPGFYKADEFGMRIENLVEVVGPEETYSGSFLGFEDLTLCPYDRALVDVERLTAAEREQVDAYHARVRDKLSPLLGDEDRKWLERATEKL